MLHHQGLPTPTVDLAAFSDQLGQAWGVTYGYPVSQYLAWCEQTGIFGVLASAPATLAEICARTNLSPAGADALLGVARCLGVVSYESYAEYALTPVGDEFLLARSPFYVGHALYLACTRALPTNFWDSDTITTNPADVPRLMRGGDTAARLRIQHSRNFAPAIVAARTGQFRRIRHLVDMAGGSGVFAIPLALDYPAMHITLIEQPAVIPYAREYLAKYGLEERVKLVGIDMYEDAWCFEECDGIVFGNVFHGASDKECRLLARKSFAALAPSGKVWLHEVLFNDDRDGPLLAALWNANMVARKRGAHQRTAVELLALLRQAGFINGTCTPTAGGFSLLSGDKLLAK